MADLVFARLAEPSHKLPLPDRGGRLFRSAGETVDRENPFYRALFADGSLVVAEKPRAPETKAGRTKAASKED